MKKDYIYILGCNILWGLFPIFWHLLSSLNAFYTLASRIIWSLLFTVLLFAFSSGFSAVKAVWDNKRERIILMLSGVMLTINWGSYIIAVNNNMILDASLAYYINPILLIIAGATFFKEKLSHLQWVSVIISFTGVMISIIKYAVVPYMALIIGGSFAVYGALKKMVKTDSKTSLFFETLTVMPFAIIFIIYSEITGTGSIGVIHGWQFLLLPATGIVTGVPLLLYAKGLKGTDLSLSGILAYISPSLQFILGAFVYNEEFDLTRAITFVFVWLGLVLYLISQNRISKRLPAEKTNPVDEVI